MFSHAMFSISLCGIVLLVLYVWTATETFLISNVYNSLSIRVTGHLSFFVLFKIAHFVSILKEENKKCGLRGL